MPLYFFYKLKYYLQPAKIPSTISLPQAGWIEDVGLNVANNFTAFSATALEAQSLQGMPEQFGGGCTASKPVAENAAKLFATFKPASPIHPIWGKEMVDGILATCK